MCEICRCSSTGSTDSTGSTACLQPNHPRRGPAILLYYGPALMQKARLFHFTAVIQLLPLGFHLNPRIRFRWCPKYPKNIHPKRIFGCIWLSSHAFSSCSPASCQYKVYGDYTKYNPFLRQILEGRIGRPLQHDAHHSGTLAFNNLGFTCNKMQQSSI